MTELLNDDIIKQIREVFDDGLNNPVHVMYFGSQENCQYCDETRQLAEEVTAMIARAHGERSNLVFAQSLSVNATNTFERQAQLLQPALDRLQGNLGFELCAEGASLAGHWFLLPIRGDSTPYCPVQNPG